MLIIFHKTNIQCCENNLQILHFFMQMLIMSKYHYDTISKFLAMRSNLNLVINIKIEKKQSEIIVKYYYIGIIIILIFDKLILYMYINTRLQL